MVQKRKAPVAAGAERQVRVNERRKHIPEPITPVRGSSIAPTPKPTRVPPSPPSYFPNDLWPETNLVLLKARKQFPYQTHTFELCKHITLELTPLLCKAVKTGKMKAGAVHHEGLGGMEDLLHSLLAYNDDGPRTGFGLSNQTYRLGERVRQSDEWLAQVKAIAEVSAETSASTMESQAMKTAVGNAREASIQPTLEKKSASIHGRKKRTLNNREQDILKVLKKGEVHGTVYCHALEREKIPPREEWNAQGCPMTYPEAYKLKEWRKRIQDEKYRISQFLPKNRTRHSSQTSVTRRKRVNL